jgi:hypothetical protein
MKLMNSGRRRGSRAWAPFYLILRVVAEISSAEKLLRLLCIISRVNAK